MVGGAHLLAGVLERNDAEEKENYGQWFVARGFWQVFRQRNESRQSLEMPVMHPFLSDEDSVGPFIRPIYTKTTQ